MLVAAITADLIDQAPAERLIARAAKAVGGGGGGTGAIASAGGRHPERLDQAVAVAAEDAAAIRGPR
ncbi:DHHA1 domain-containing protein [Streptomyces sp. NPDC014870]|uniref:DHHA1 domain-containing protein n=1 Tax=Streptomyces sp. NPDC014870 TaxID=3364925 RepID=UPI0036FC95F2